ncbi:uncharacterized protein LOC127879997 isoform X5 [Dreissena polymorpha]|uniref:Uncharacterized protein n=1 Tax=Dreissena polymorpha TaxID=45954 RepID=A0A9D4MSX5_DREPO|nr:uncharacterized protein LOC127879997 isoform X5 [Dreissena polymorpha]KAH3881214.1 hypothetical protein DPMN_005137 [Dreissena polymorpha]
MDARVSGCTFKPGTAFTLVVQKYANFATADDRVYAVTCSVDLIPQVLSASVNTTMLDQTSAVSDTFNTTVTFAVTTETGTTLSTVRVGQDVKLLVRIPAADNAAVGFTIRTVKFQVGSVPAVTIISAGCPVGGAPMNPPVKTDIGSGGVQNVPFKMFVPVSISNRPTPTSTIAAVSIEVEVTLCNGNCTAVTCTTASGRKRRFSDTDVMTLTRPLVILPPSMNDVNETVYYKERSEAQQMPTIPTALIATVVSLGLVLTLCIVVLVIMFCRLRRHGDARDSKKSSFENKAYN